MIETKEQVLELLTQITNPETGVSVGQEGRFGDIKFSGEDLVIEYDRTGLSTSAKHKIEDQIYSTLEGKTNFEIVLLAKSKDSSEVYNSQGIAQKPTNQNPASLKVGHGQLAEKKRIEGVKHIFAVASGKGGVGKSTFTSNLAVTLVNAGRKVGVIDADIYGPSMPMLFDRRNIRPEATLDKKIIPLENYGVKFLSFGNFIEEDEPVVWRGPMLGGVLNQFFFETDWGELDYLIIDLPPGTGDVQLSMIQNLELDGSIIISTPQDVALLDARKGLNMFHKLHIPVIGMVENMSSFICDSCDKEHFIFGAQGVSNAASSLGVGYLGRIPIELELRKGADFGQPYMTAQKFEGRKVWESYRDIAKRVDSYFNPTDNKKSFMSKIFGPRT